MSNTMSFQSVIQDFPDPRQTGKVVFPLDEILLLRLCGTISGCDSFVKIAEYGGEKLPFLRELAPFEAGIPSHGTLSAVFRQLDPVTFSKAFSDWAQGLGSRISDCVFAIAAFAQLPVGELLDRFGARPILIFLLTGQVFLLLGLSQATGWTALMLALVLVTMMFAEIPITSWLLSRYVKSGLRSRALSVEYILSLGMGAATVPLISVMHGAGYGFQIQFTALAVSAAIVLLAAFFLPSAPVSTPVDHQISSD